MLCVIATFLAVVLYKVASNYLKYRYCFRMQSAYLAWLDKNNEAFLTNKIKIISTFKEAGLRDAEIPMSTIMETGVIANYKASVFLNFPSRNAKDIYVAKGMFYNAIGVFRSRMLDAINPIYWIELVVFMPKHLITYLGIDMEKTAAKLCNVLSSFIWWVLVIAIAIYKEQLLSFANNLIKFLG